MKPNADGEPGKKPTIAGNEKEPSDQTETLLHEGDGDLAIPSEPVGDSQAKFQAIFEHSPLAIMFTDAEGTITTCNDNASQLFGAPKKKLIGFSYKSIRDDLMRAAVAKALSGQKSHFEGEYLTVTGNVFTLMRANFSPAYHSDGSVSGVIGIFEDITDRRLVEKEMEQLIRQLQDTLSKVQKMSGLLPICSCCKRIRDKKGAWNVMETYLRDHFHIVFSHGICPECAEKMYKM
jgi:PAS domain S-box-containing protein